MKDALSTISRDTTCRMEPSQYANVYVVLEPLCLRLICPNHINRMNFATMAAIAMTSNLLIIATNETHIVEQRQ